MAPRKKPKVDRDDHEPKVDRDDHEPKVDHDDHEPQVGDDTVTPGLDNTMTHSKRGRTNMYCLYKDRVTGVIKDVDFDKLGRPIGENGTKLQSYIGVLAREKVKITYPTWKHVPKDIKEQIWKAVTLTFNVSPAWKKSCLSSAGSKWRTFKTTLTKEYVYKRIDTPYLNIPPDGFDIDLNVWKDFVISRLSDKFKQMSDEHKELAKLKKWPHNLSRKGYARYASENQSLLSGDNDLDRATLWLEARKKKDGEFENDELKEIASKIVRWFYREKKNSGPEYEVEGGILSQALESTEHSGRVRGIGGHVIPSSYVYLHNNKLSNNELCKQHEMELMAQRKRNIEQDERIRRLEEQIFKNHGHKTEIEELGSCTGKNCMCVSIEKAEEKSAILPFPTGDCLTIDDAIGSHVTWPMHLMKLYDQVI
ncbi:hypothetical protein ACS0TY_029595 [Phlomoides rotata]